MRKENQELNRILFNELLRQSRERNVTHRWNVYSLMVIYSVLVVIIVLILKDASMITVGIIAVAGLATLLIISYIQGRKIRWKDSHEVLTARPETSENAIIPEEKLAEFHDSPLTRRELEILTYVVKGDLNKQIAFRMGISEQTVKNHISSILRKLQVEDRVEAAALAVQKNWIEQEDE